MIQDVVQRLSIIQQTSSRLVLRELPLLDWSATFILLISALLLSVAEFWISAVIAVLIAFYFIFAGRLRIIEFDASLSTMLIHYQTPFKRHTVNELNLDTLQRAYLFRGDDNGTQIILVRRDGEEFGISVYSEDSSDWKEPIVIAINAILYEAHKEDTETSDTDNNLI